MNPIPEKETTGEFQFAMALLAHAARNDNATICASLDYLAESSTDLCPLRVIAALLWEFERGISLNNRDRLARWFTTQAIALAANTTSRGEGRAS